MSDFWANMQKAYGPLGNLLQQGTQAVFGPESTFFPKSWGVGNRLPGQQVEVAGAEDEPEEIAGVAEDWSDYTPQGPGLTDNLDLGQVHDDFKKASQGDRDAQARLAALQDSPGVAELGNKKNPLEGLMGDGIAASLSQPMEMATHNFKPADFRSPAAPQSGGGGVQVQDHQAGEGFDWGNALGSLGVGLVDMANVTGHPNAPVGHGGLYELQKSRMQEEQVEGLRRRQMAFDTAYKAAQEIPPEALAQFPELGKAVQALQAAAQTSRKIDDEKAASAFLLAKAKYGKEIQDMLLQSKVQDQLQVEQGLQTGRTAQVDQHLSQLQHIVDAGGPGADVARLEIAKSAPYNFEGVITDQATYLKLKEARDLKEMQLQTQAMIAGDNRAARAQVAAINAAASQERQQGAAMGRIGTGLNATLNNTLRELMRTDPTTGEPADAAAAVIKMYNVHTDDIIAAGQAAGMRVFKAGLGNGGKPQISVNGNIMDGLQALAYIRQKIGMPSAPAMSYTGPGDQY